MPTNYSNANITSSAKTRNNAKRPDLYQYLLLGAIQTNPGNSATHIKNITGTNTNGYYWIKKNDGTAVNVYCIMDTDGGGWSRLNNSISSISNSQSSTSWSGESLIVNFADNNGCAGTTNHTITGTIPYTEMYIFHYRNSGIGQCQGFSGAVTSGYYTPPWINIASTLQYTSFCTWGSGPHADFTARYYFYKIAGSNSFSTTYTTACGGGSGQATEDIWVRAAS
jgi:hypothetical protein